jgi:type I restriction enzyme S subunit
LKLPISPRVNTSQSAGRSGTIGNVHYIEKDFWPHNTSLWVTDFKGNYPLYIFYLYSSLKFNRFSSGSGVPTLNRNDLHDFFVPLPPTKAEQTAIATALNDADILINQLEKLLTKKRNIKTGAMQELLKPKEGWEVKKLGEIVISLSSGKSNTQSEKGNYPIYGSTGVIGWKNYFDYEGEKILIARVGANAGIVNKVMGKYLVSDNTLILSFSNNIDIDFLYFVLIKFNLNSLVFGSGQPLITGGQLKELHISYPKTKSEQTRIATIISDMDNEITALEHKLAKHKQIKQGMMQELLTGRIRLVENV